MIGHLLRNKKGEIETAERQEAWIKSTIERYYLDKQHMYSRFSAIEGRSAERRKNALGKFLELNSDYSVFEILPLEASRVGGCGSQIPYMQERISYLTSLLPMLSGYKFLKHKQKIERNIDKWKAQIKREEVEELLESLG